MVGALGAAAGLAAWGWFEAGWLRLATVAVPVPGLPEELRGLRIGHLSDFHLGVPGRGRGASERAVAWAVERRPDLVVVSGDLLSRPSGETDLRRLLERLPGAFVVLGNHDFAQTRDPFSRPSPLYELEPAVLLLDEARTVQLRGCRVQLAGVDPQAYLLGRARPHRLVDPGADLRILVCHFPRVVDALPRGAFHLVLAGHMHGGQICVPYPGGKLQLAHLGARYTGGLYLKPAATLHVSPGLGTTFVPFRFFSRPEATELVLEPA
jgi:predicted MPP superfamily phosphohydrolase